MSNNKFSGKKHTYYKQGDIVYGLSSKLRYAKESEKRQHVRFNGWGDLEKLYKDEYSR